MQHHYLKKVFRDFYNDKSEKSFWSNFIIKELTPELCLLLTY